MKLSRVFNLIALALLFAAGAAMAQGGDGTATARLRAFDEVPALSTPGGGHFTADITGDEIEWSLNYFNLQGNILQAHLHFAQKGVNGGIMIFLCSNLGNGPAGTPACPPEPATVTGTSDASDVIGGAISQSIGPGELQQVLRAIRAGIVYANVHTDLHPGGEIRGQLLFTPTGGAAVEE